MQISLWTGVCSEGPAISGTYDPEPLYRSMSASRQTARQQQARLHRKLTQRPDPGGAKNSLLSSKAESKEKQDLSIAKDSEPSTSYQVKQFSKVVASSDSLKAPPSKTENGAIDRAYVVEEESPEIFDGWNVPNESLYKVKIVPINTKGSPSKMGNLLSKYNLQPHASLVKYETNSNEERIVSDVASIAIDKTKSQDNNSALVTFIHNSNTNEQDSAENYSESDEPATSRTVSDFVFERFADIDDLEDIPDEILSSEMFDSLDREDYDDYSELLETSGSEILPSRRRKLVKLASLPPEKRRAILAKRKKLKERRRKLKQQENLKVR